jgi:alpha-L-fucosidase 2
MKNEDGGVYDNLLDAHPPFQIDGNFGITAGIAEMLLQSHNGFIHLLPALPSAWSKGNFQGLRAQGDFTISLSWEKSLPLECSVYSGSGNFCTLCCAGAKITGLYGEEEPIDFYAVNNTVTFNTNTGTEYSVLFEPA